MSIVVAQDLGKYFGAQDVFSGVSFSIAHGDKIGFVGPNGAGKTTLLRIILGQEEPTAGSISRSRGLRLAYLPQQPSFSSEQTLYGEMLTLYADLRAQQARLLALADEMATAADPTEAMERYAEAEQRFDLAGGYEYENAIKRVLGGLGFDEPMYDWPITVLSGGQVTRALLAKLLLQEPDLLILDEPTNYLDLAALEWLENYLQAWRQTLMIVSHDRYFLDKVVNHVWELNRGRLDTYRGNYSAYLVQRADRRLRQQREYETQQEFIARTEEFVRRNKAGQRSKEARGRETRLGHLERIEAPQENRHMHLRLATALRSGDNVLRSEGALIGYERRPEDGVDAADAGGAEVAGDRRHVLFDTGEFLIRRGQRVALLGPNGSGKTTFFKAILGQLTPLSGHLRLGVSVKVGYLPQSQAWLDPAKTVLEQILDGSDLSVSEARNLLGRFLFSGDDVYKVTGALSGGELARVALANLTMHGANFLLLDEPTTHLDIDSQEILQEVLQQFSGTILFISHDRYLIDALASDVWYVQDRGLTQFEGNYSAWLADRQHQAEAATAAAVETPRGGSDEQRRAQRQQQTAERRRTERLEELEAAIEALEKRLEATIRLLDEASTAQDAGRVHELGTEYERIQHDLEAQIHAWEQLAGGAAEEA